MAILLVKDKEIIDNIGKDENAIVAYHHRASDMFCFFDSAHEFEDQVLKFQASGVFIVRIVKYLNIFKYRFYIFNSSNPLKINPDKLAFQLGHQTTGITHLVKNKCWACKKEDTENFYPTCTSCKMAIYCCKECQTGDWKRHKKFCKTVQLPKNPPLETKTVEFSLASLFDR